MIAALPPALRGLEQLTEPYPVAVSDRLQADAKALALHLSHVACP